MKMSVGIWNDREGKLTLVEVDTSFRTDGLYV